MLVEPLRRTRFLLEPEALRLAAASKPDKKRLGPLRKALDAMAAAHEAGVSVTRIAADLAESAIETITDAMPCAEEMDPESCYLGFEINFRSHASKEKIEAVFDFCRDECDLHILPPNSKVGDYLGGHSGNVTLQRV